MLISDQQNPSCSHEQNLNRSSSCDRNDCIRSTTLSEHQYQMTMNGRRSLIRNPENRVGLIKVRLVVLLLTIQAVLCSQKSPMLSNKRYPIFGKKGTPIKQGIDCRYRHQSVSIRIRGGGNESPINHSDTAILSNLRSFFHDIVKETRDSCRQRVEDHMEGQAKQRLEQLERNQRWREAAESIVPRENVIMLSPSFSYATPAGSIKSTSELPIKVLKLGTLACILLGSLGRAGIFDGDKSNNFRLRIKSFWRALELIGRDVWEDGVLPTYKNARYNLERWYHRHAKTRIFALQARIIRLEQRVERFFQSNPRAPSRIKAILAIIASYGMISSQMFSPLVLRLWKPILLTAALSELNHSCSTTTDSLGTTLDELLDRYRNLIRSTIFKVFRRGRGDFYKKKRYGRWKGVPTRVDNRFAKQDAMYQIRRKLAKQGLLLLCSVGLALMALI